MTLSSHAFPLHPAQQDIYIDQLLNVNSPHYNINNYFKIKGPLDTGKLIEAVISAHQVFDVFKMAIGMEDFTPNYHIVDQDNPFAVQELDFSDHTDPSGAIRIWIQNKTDEPFLIEKTKLLVEHYLLKAADDEHYYYFKFHHLLFDGYSVRVWTNYISDKYKSLLNNEQQIFTAPSYLAEVEKAVAHYGSETYNVSGDYWKKKITIKPDTIVQRKHDQFSESGRESSFYTYTLEKDEQLLLAQLGIDSQARLQHLTIAAMAVYLAKMYGQDNSFFGTTAHKRKQRYQREIVGMFSGVVPFLANYQSDIRLIDFIKDVVRSQKEDYDHLDYLGGDLSRHFKHDPLDGPFFDFIINHIVFDLSLDLGPDIQTDHFLMFSKHQQTPLEIMWFDYAEKEPLKLVIGFRHEYFQQTEIVLLVQQLLDIFKQFATALEQNIGEIRVNPEQAVSAFISKEKDVVPVLTAEDLVILQSFNSTAGVYPADKTLVNLFASAAAQYPEEIALIYADQRLTYGELDERSNQLGHYLRAAGVREDTVVPICIERSPEMIIGILGILKSGGAYAPIDPDYPRERVNFMLADTDARIVIGNENSRSLLAHQVNIRMISMDGDLERINQESAEPVLTDLRSDHLGYVIYTSGSTGQPKGVMVEHRNVVNMITDRQELLKVVPGDRIAAFTNYTFDPFVEQLFLALLHGAGLVLIAKEVQLDTEALVSVLAQEQVTYILNTPGFLRNVPCDKAPGSLKDVMVGGERCTTLLAQQWTGNPGLNFYVAYGPTECTVTSTIYHFDTNRAEGKYLPIGKPVKNTQIYIVDAAGNLLPVGMPGEIWIGGAGVARGYLNRDELTREKFIADPFVKGGRLYKTGDIGRWFPDGNIEFIGRIDDQVKVRGYRIELGEIENAVQQSGLVDQTVVIACEDQSGSNQLICYVISAQNFDQQELISYLENRLPEYMVPHVFMELTEFPLTPHGKLDKKALPLVDTKARLNINYVPAENELQTKLIAIWESLLQVSRVGIRDSFFELGGHSLLAMRVSGYIQKEMGINVPVKTIFQCKNIEKLALYITQNVSADADNVPIPVNLRKEHVPLSYGQEGLWRIDQLNGSTHYHMPMYFRLSGTFSIDALEQSINEVVNRHEILRTVIHQDINGNPFQFVLQKDSWSLDRITDYSGGEAGLDNLLAALSSAVIALHSDHMLRGHLIRISDQEHILVLILHHIAADGWSLSVLIRELVALYEMNTTGVSPVLPALPLQYGDYSVWQRNQEDSQWGLRIDYWKNRLAGVDQLELPTDYPRPSIQSTNGAMSVFTIDTGLAAGLQSLSRQHGATLHMTMLSAFKILLHRYSGQDDICVGSVIAGRTRQELEGLIGYFANTLALRSNLGANPAFVDFLQQVKETALGAYEHQDVPFERVVEAVGQERDKSRNPLYQVIFTVQNIPEVPEFRLGEAVLSAKQTGRTTSQFDLNVSVVESSNGIEISVEYCTDLFRADTIDRMFGNYRELLRSIVLSPAREIDLLPMLGKSQQQELLYDFNSTAVAYPHHQTLVDLFMLQSDQSPDAIALVYLDQQLTYRELDQRSNQLGHYLRKAGVREDKLVPICIDRSPGYDDRYSGHSESGWSLCTGRFCLSSGADQLYACRYGSGYSGQYGE